MSDDHPGRFSVTVEPGGAPHYHHDGNGGLRACSLPDELAEPTFWVSTAPPPTPAEVAAHDWSEWTEMGCLTDD